MITLMIYYTIDLYVSICLTAFRQAFPCCAPVFPDPELQGEGHRQVLDVHLIHRPGPRTREGPNPIYNSLGQAWIHGGRLPMHSLGRLYYIYCQSN